MYVSGEKGLVVEVVCSLLACITSFSMLFLINGICCSLQLNVRADALVPTPSHPPSIRISHNPDAGCDEANPTWRMYKIIYTTLQPPPRAASGRRNDKSAVKS